MHQQVLLKMQANERAKILLKSLHTGARRAPIAVKTLLVIIITTRPSIESGGARFVHPQVKRCHHVVHKVPVATLSRVGLVSYIIKVEEVTVLVWTI